mgnify:CR=1 FL=1
MNLKQLCTCIAIFNAAAAGAASFSAPLTLADEGNFFVNGENINSKYPGASLVTGPTPPGRITINQMYVHYRIPAERKALPVIMVHGNALDQVPDSYRRYLEHFFVRQRGDEIDAGVGGRAAVEIGRRLARLAQNAQVLVVTHLPQVAASADHQWQVSKGAAKGAVTSRVTVLAEDERVEEIARMLGGVKITETTRKHAAEMLGVKS